MTAADSGDVGLFTFMNERDAPPVADQPRIEALSWRAGVASTWQLHLVLLVEAAVVRPTSAVTAFEIGWRVVITESGRQYRLLYPPEVEPPAKSLLQANAVRAGLAGGLDVGEQLWTLMSAADAAPGLIADIPA